MKDNKIKLYASHIRPVEEKTELLIQIRIDNSLGFISEFYFHEYQKNDPNVKHVKLEYFKQQNNCSYFKMKTVLEEIAVHYYYFSMQANGRNMYICKDGKGNLYLAPENAMNWRITVYKQNFKTPNWAKGAVMYHCFADRFCRNKSVIIKPKKGRKIHEDWDELPEWQPNENGEYLNNDFFGGNLKGIASKLNYLKSLGVTILYLSPCMQSQSNHRYDTADYENVDEYLGTNEDLKDLCLKAQRKGINIIIDGVYDHTGNDSRYFNEYGNYNEVGAFQGKDSPYYDWYKKYNGKFVYWWGFNTLPVCNLENKEYQMYIYGEKGIIIFLISLGIKGIRFDVADELTDGFIYNCCETAKNVESNFFTIGEIWDNGILKEKDFKQRKYLLGNGFDSIMNYQWTEAVLKYVRFGDYNILVNKINEILHDYPKEVVDCLMNSLSTHDITRAITTLVGPGIEKDKYEWVWDIGNKDRKWQFENDKLPSKLYKEGRKKFQVAFAILTFLPGIISVFYGDEVGLTGYKDPFNRKPFPWSHKDKKLLRFVRAILKIKCKLKFLKEADYNTLVATEKVFIFERKDLENRIIIQVNNSKEIIPIKYYNRDKDEIIFKENITKNYLNEYGIIIIKKN